MLTPLAWFTLFARWAEALLTGLAWWPRALLALVARRAESLFTRFARWAEARLARLARGFAFGGRSIASRAILAAHAVPLRLLRAFVGQADVDVRAAWTPVARSRAIGLAGGALGFHRFIGRGPHAAAFEPLQHRGRLGTLQLHQRRLQIGGLARAEGGGALADQDGPVGGSRRHGQFTLG